MSRNPDCRGHYGIDANNSLWIEYFEDTTLCDLEIKISEFLISDFRIFHNKSILYGGTGPSCAKRAEIIGPSGMILDGSIFCENCHLFLSRDVKEALKMDDITLGEHGVPDNHMLMLALPYDQQKYIVPNITS